ncbi:zinc finger BED domain-containing protein RICESLEEPER 1-like [Impatiens glandulifera]|uniref:zinc finger BED domain-containing protein RICESLEEPER 1-like n=1 Tax=Impatiens glandulifera TaxID=253017 RepID=UPI001FB164A7|nr:zinc finger BED domain-containing protein RICESLEEPER 1-like [Impatiens glandulifera]
MVITGHWIDFSWKLQKRVLSFANIPPPRGGLQISDAIFKCMKEWGIENKVVTITVDNASNNDVAIRWIRVIEDIIGDIREGVEYVNRSEARRVQFAECVQQLQLKDQKLIRDCKTRWNSTFEMLSCALKFKEAFKMFNERDPFYDCFPSEEGWKKTKFDKYWGECNLLMALAAVLDPTKKMLAVEFCFPKLYSHGDAQRNICKVKDALVSLYDVYVAENACERISRSFHLENIGSSNSNTTQRDSSSNWDDFDAYCAEIETSEPSKSELLDYLEKGRLKKSEIPKDFSCLDWWKMNILQYPVLSKMVADILPIPVSSVASEAKFSARTRVIDSYRSSLSPETVQVLLCGGDWLRHLHGVKKKYEGK